jgi:hypothetical protein
VVAGVDDELVGMAVAQAEGQRAWVLLVALAAGWRGRGIGISLLTALEARLRSLGVRPICTVLPEGATGYEALRNSGYECRRGLTYFEKVEGLGSTVANLLDPLGGVLLPPGLLEQVAGMRRETGTLPGGRSRASPSRSCRCWSRGFQVHPRRWMVEQGAGLAPGLPAAGP